MKIGQFITAFPSKEYIPDEKIYGSSRAAYDLSICLAKKEHQVNVFTTSDTFDDKVEYSKNLTVYRYGTNIKLFSTRMSFGMFYKTIDKNVDIIHVHFDIPPGPFAGLRLAKMTKKPLVVTYHGDWDESYGSFFRKKGVSFFNRNFVDKLLIQANQIISPTENYIEESRFLKKYKDKIVVIPNGIDKKQFEVMKSKIECRKMLNLPLDSKLILFLGAINLRKGPDILLMAMVEVLKKCINVNLIFVGDGNFAPELKSLAIKYGMEKNIYFSGYISENLKPFYYNAADIFVLPSTINTEVFPLVLLEAMASNLPIITSDLHTFENIIEDGKNGLITKKGDSIDLSTKIIQLLENDEFRNKLSENAKNNIEKYSWDNIAEKTELIYNELV